jgi:hypothetical protein
MGFEWDFICFILHNVYWIDLTLPSECVPHMRWG